MLLRNLPTCADCSQVFKAERPLRSLRVYHLHYEDSQESDKFTAAVSREVTIFQDLIRQKEFMVLPDAMQALDQVYFWQEQQQPSVNVMCRAWQLDVVMSPDACFRGSLRCLSSAISTFAPHFHGVFLIVCAKQLKLSQDVGLIGSAMVWP